MANERRINVHLTKLAGSLHNPRRRLINKPARILIKLILMKKTLIIIFFISLKSVSYSQDQYFDRDLTTGVYADGGWNIPVRVTTKYITEETSPWHGYGTWSAGVKFSLLLSEYYRIEVAACFSEYKVGFELSPPIYDEMTIYTEILQIVSIPVTLKRYMEKKFFFSAGTIIDFGWSDKPVRVDPQTGFGLTIGVGKEFRLNNLILDLAPGLELHSLVPFNSEDNQQRLFVAGLRIGFSYNFPSAKDLKERENGK